ncbi:PRC-barrel domain-containing protein [Burkholderia plantarii]|uniref:PRC-barrel domain protein n=1 Tax=Burkholderia plantarii TaxID=41899 RepID=A0A0B6RUF3_BURPL|nr:PRC-barrel domain-containing protein [Burkholderia plantarii]AJK45784.1 PRC-barrel domain protein [Burkholderia plantarii]
MNPHPDTGTESGASGRAPDRIVGRATSTDGPGPDVMAAATLDGNRVYATDGVHVGHIKDIMLDVRGGRIAYAVLSSGGLLGIGDKLVAVPWHALTLDTDRKCFLLAVTAQQVRDAPGFDRHRWPSFADPAWVASTEPAVAQDTGWEPDDIGRFDVDTGIDIDAPPHETSPSRPEPRGGQH